MDDDRFEIELTPVAEHRWRQHERPDAPATEPIPRVHGNDPVDDGIVVTGPPPDDRAGAPGGAPGSDRTRLVATAAAAAVVALFLGWVLGRAGGGEPSADEATPTDSTAQEVTEAANESTLPAGEPIPPVRTTAPRRTTTTTVLEIELGTIGVDERLAGVPVELVGWSNHRIVEVDLGAGATRTVPVDVRSVEPQFMRVGPDWVLIASGSSESMWTVDAVGSVEIAAIDDPWSIQWVPGTDRFWRLDDESWPVSATLVEMTIDGSPTGAELELPAGSVSGWGWSWIADPAGGVLTVAAGGLYSLDVDGAALLGRGDLIAIGTTTALLRTCDEQLDCGHVVVDRATGVSRAVVPVDQRGAPVELASTMDFWGWGPFSPHRVSPDGRWAAVTVGGTDPPALGVLHLDSGRVIELMSDWSPDTVEFSSDSRYAFHLATAVPYVLDLERGDHFPVFTEQVVWDALGVRDVATPPR